MKKLLLIVSLLLPIVFSHVNISSNNEIELNEECDSATSIVRIVDNYNSFKSNGVVYKTDDKYNYIITTSKILKNVNSYEIIYEDNTYKKTSLLGYDSNYEIAVFKTEKVENIKSACIANSNYLISGQMNYLKGYFDLETNFHTKANLIKSGELVSTDDYKNIFKSVLQINGDNKLNGTAVFDELNRLVGVMSCSNTKMIGTNYMVDSNKLIKIADSIVKTGNYNPNYIKYSLEDYVMLNSETKESYGVSNKINYGVVVKTFNPLKYIFGGLNQGMTIVAVNGIEIKNMYELDKQFSRYDKDSTICLKVIKGNGKEAFYYEKI